MIYRRHYTPASLAAFVAFLKTRVTSEVDDILVDFCDGRDVYDGLDGNLLDLLWQLLIRGTFVTPDWDVVKRLPRAPDPHQTAKIFTLANRPPLTCVVLTVPRRKLKAIYDKVFRKADATCSFEIRYKTTNSSKYNSIIPIFGKLLLDEDGLTARIDPDPAHWHGTSDLLVCVYLPTHTFCLGPAYKANKSYITFHLYRDWATMMRLPSITEMIWKSLAL
jgi:hypothetical protein